MFFIFNTKSLYILGAGVSAQYIKPKYKLYQDARKLVINNLLYSSFINPVSEIKLNDQETTRAQHKDAAYAFINFMLQDDIAANIALYTSNSTTNLAAQNRLPAAIRNNKMIYPPQDIPKRGQFLTNVGENRLPLYEKYWEELKMSS